MKLCCLKCTYWKTLVKNILSGYQFTSRLFLESFFLRISILFTFKSYHILNKTWLFNIKKLFKKTTKWSLETTLFRFYQQHKGQKTFKFNSKDALTILWSFINDLYDCSYISKFHCKVIRFTFVTWFIIKHLETHLLNWLVVS